MGRESQSNLEQILAGRRKREGVRETVSRIFLQVPNKKRTRFYPNFPIDYGITLPWNIMAVDPAEPPQLALAQLAPTRVSCATKQAQLALREGELERAG